MSEFTTFTKTLQPEDLKRLPLQILVEEHFDKAPQHPLRHWEYGMCLAAAHQMPKVDNILDVGGHGSPLSFMFADLMPGTPFLTIDPNINSNLHTYHAENLNVFDLVTCISVIEHTTDVDEFVFDLAQVTAPGGLLFLTMDMWDQPAGVKDSAHFNWMRNQIFNPQSWKGLADRLHDFGFMLFGEADWNYHGPQVYDYTFASLCMRKRS